MKKMLPLKRTRYYTMNSWNLCKAPAYNLKIYNVIADNNIRNKLYDLIQYDEFWAYINSLVYDFEAQTGWSAGFNGRSGGYLVLYSSKGTCATVEDKDVPVDVLKAFRKLAHNIVKTAIYFAENATIEEEEYVATRKVLKI